MIGKVPINKTEAAGEPGSLAASAISEWRFWDYPTARLLRLPDTNPGHAGGGRSGTSGGGIATHQGKFLSKKTGYSLQKSKLTVY
jgi:hypothetical protein